MVKESLERPADLQAGEESHVSGLSHEYQGQAHFWDNPHGDLW